MLQFFEGDSPSATSPPTSAPAIPSGCGGPRYLKANTGMIQSLNYGTSNSYPSNVDCTWVIQAPANKVSNVMMHSEVLCLPTTFSDTLLLSCHFPLL